MRRLLRICLWNVFESRRVKSFLDKSNSNISSFQETVIPDDKTQITAFSVIENQLKDQLRVIVNEPIAEGEIEPFQNVKKLYRSCLNTAEIDALDSTPVLNVLTSSMGGWPVVTGNTWAANGQLFEITSFLSFSLSLPTIQKPQRVRKTYTS